MFCAMCGADNPNDGRFCSKCGAMLQGQRAMPPQAPPFESPTAPYVGPTETSGKAIGSLICGLLFFLFPTAIIAVVLGHLSLSDFRKARGRLTGRGMAVAGLVLGYAGVSFIPILLIAAIAIPNLLRARIAANEASAVGSVRTIETAALIYEATYSNGFPFGLTSMDGAGAENASCDRAQLIDSILASGRKSGYEFTYVPTAPADGVQPTLSSEATRHGCTVPGAAGFEVHADPINRGQTGQRSFYSDQTGVMRFSVDGPATVDSSPIR